MQYECRGRKYRIKVSGSNQGLVSAPETPTRRRGDDDPLLLDIILTDESMQVSNITHSAPLGKSDHSVITFDFHCYLDYSAPKEIYCYNRGNYEDMRKELVNSDWFAEITNTIETKSVEEF